MNKTKKIFWASLGFICLGLAYAGMIIPGLPWSIFVVSAAYCFAKSSERMHRWIYSHKIFGPFLTNWTEKKIFPTKLKYVMIVTMASTVAFTWLSTGNTKAALYTGVFMILVAIWAWRFPGSEAEYQRRVDAGKRVAWLK